MNPEKSTESPLAGLLRLALPVIGVNLGMVAMGAVDTLMVGRLSAEALAAVAIANVYYNTISMFGLGVLLALDPLIAQALGAGDEAAALRAGRDGVRLSWLLALPVMVALVFTGPALSLSRQPAEVIPLAQNYALLLIPSIPFVLWFGIGRSVLQARHRVGLVFWTILLANGLNGLLNYGLIFGRLGMPELGVAGSAIATTASRVAMLLILSFIASDAMLPLFRRDRDAPGQTHFLGTIWRVGLPIAGHIQLEMGAFSAVALLMGQFGTVAMAGHQIALNLASMAFMVPMGVGIAATVMIGRAVGARDPAAVTVFASRALLTGAIFMCGTALLFSLLPGLLASVYTNDAAVHAMAATLLPIAGIFQVFDGLQVTSVGVLRGLGDTRAPMLINLIGFGCCGLGASWWLAWHAGFGPSGLWWGLVIGLAVVALILMARVRFMLRRARTNIDALIIG